MNSDFFSNVRECIISSRSLIFLEMLGNAMCNISNLRRKLEMFFTNIKNRVRNIL